MHGVIVSPSLGIYATSVCQPTGFQTRRAIRDRQGVRSAPANIRYRRRTTAKAQNQNAFGNRSINKKFNRINTAFGHRSSPNNNSHGDQMRLKVDDVICLAEQTREAASQENRRTVLEEAQKTIRHEVAFLSSSRPHSVIGMGLQALTSPMPLSAKDKNTRMQMDHIPTLLPLPSDRAFIPSPDRDNPRHVNTPVEDLEDERSQSVARQCCEIMGRSMCTSCRKLERRLLNRERAERECPRMRISQQNITTTQVVKRFYPHLTDSEIQDKIARGEIAKAKFPSRMYLSDGESDSGDDDSGKEEQEQEVLSSKNHLTPVDHVVVTKKQKRDKHENNVIFSDNPIFALTQLKSKLKGLTSTPLFFTDLKGVQAKILSGEVDRKRYLLKPPDEHVRLKSAVSTLSTASSNKSTLSKIGLKLSESLMPVFVSPRKVKIYNEPSYKVYYEPPLLSKRRQIPNPAFFAGSSEAYSLPERLPDIIEFADSKIKALQKQGRSTSSMSFASNISEDAFEYEGSDPLSSSRREVFEKSERDGEAMLGDSLSSPTPRMWLKSTKNVIDENLTGEEEHAIEDHGLEINGGQNVEDSHRKILGDQKIEDNEITSESRTPAEPVDHSELPQPAQPPPEHNEREEDTGHDNEIRTPSVNESVPPPQLNENGLDVQNEQVVPSPQLDKNEINVQQEQAVPSPQQDENESDVQQEQVEFDDEGNKDHENDDLHSETNSQEGNLISDEEDIELEDRSYNQMDLKDENIFP